MSDPGASQALAGSESQNEASRPDFSRPTGIDFPGAAISPHTGFILLHEVNELQYRRTHARLPGRFEAPCSYETLIGPEQHSPGPGSTG
jgi:hypothetical protein